VSGTLTRCRSCGRDTTTTDDWRCTYCGQPKPLTAEPVAAPPEPAAADEPVGTPTRCGYCGEETITVDGRCSECGHPKQPPRPWTPSGPPSLWADLRPQLAAAGFAALIVVVGLIMASELLLIAAAAVLVVAVVAKIVADGW
jgi:ribosomal protein L37E